MNLDLLACPACTAGGFIGGLAPGNGCVTCARCSASYPIIGGVPCLMPQPERYLLIQLRRLHAYLAATALRQTEIAVEAEAEHVLPRTRERLQKLLRAMGVERALVSRLFGELTEGVQGTTTVPESPAPVGDFELMETYEVTFRDWAWGDVENEQARAMVQRLFEAARASGLADVGHLAVFGAGACRLAFDVHRTLAPTTTVALDFNPLPLLIANKILRGETVEAYEYPIGPHDADGVAVLQRLRQPSPTPEGLTVMLADARQPPLAPGGLDAVLTPWFIDAVGIDVRETASIINRVLRGRSPSGRKNVFGLVAVMDLLATIAASELTPGQ